VAAKKLAGRASCHLAIADAENLTGWADASIDVVSISFGMKICERARVLAEARRVLRPGGRFMCLEAARIPWPWVHSAYLAYMHWCLPLMAQIAVGGDRSAYDYLLRGIRDFPDQRSFAAELADAGFVEIAVENLTFGIVALHMATKS
jgi:ubiquinone/menaquinone biosynthesis C-methylase UbiE